MDSAAPPQVPPSINTAAPQHKKPKGSKTTQSPVTMARPWGIRAKEGSSPLEEPGAPGEGGAVGPKAGSG